MKYQNIPNTDLTPSALCLGGFPFGVKLNQETSFALLDTFFAAGGNFIDTALVYGEWLPDGKGLSEKTVGNWIKDRRNRNYFIIGTKGAHPRLNSMALQRLSREEIISDLDESLANLGTDYIDLYWLHRDDPTRPVAEIVTTLNEQVKAGKIRYFGCSNWRLDRIEEAQTFAAENGLQPFAANQPMWSLAVPNPAAFSDPTMVWMNHQLKEYHTYSHLTAIVYSSQAKGFFTKLQRSSISELPKVLITHYSNQENLAKFVRLKEVAEQINLSVSVIALSYLVSQPFPTFPIAGCSNLAQLEEILKAGDIRLSSSILDYLDVSG